jgi:hypothetical protein
MSQCVDEGRLRAYLDGELLPIERASVGAHIASCAACQAHQQRQHALAAQVATLLNIRENTPDPRAALARLRAADNQSIDTQGSKPMPSTSFWASPRRGLFAGLAAAIVLLSLLVLPPVRAAADQLLQIFRVQKVMFVPISPERIEQLKQLNFDGKTLFVGEPTFVKKPAAPRVVDSADAAAGAVGFPIAQPTVFPSAPTSTTYTVHERAVMQFKVNVESARQLLALLNIDDVKLPDSLGAKPISVDTPAFAETGYQGAGYTLSLYQGHSPTLTLPDGVDLKQLGKAGLRLLGMDADAAEKLSQQIDWSSTLIFPFPKDIRDIREVQVGAAQGLLVGEGRGDSRHWQLYWQNGDSFSMLEGRGNIDDTDIIAAAESVR